MKQIEKIKFNQSALILPVPEVEEFARSYRHQYTTDGAAGMPAHITILYPFLLHYEFDDQAKAKLSDVLSKIHPFTFYLKGLNRFTHPHALYIEPKPKESLLSMIRLVARIFPDHLPYRGSIPIEKIQPHVTIAITDSTEALDGIENAFSRDISHLLPIKIEAEELWIVVKADGQWYYLDRMTLYQSYDDEP